MTQMDTTSSAAGRLTRLGYSLPDVNDDAKYTSARTVGSHIYISGQLPYRGGVLLAQGALGADIDVSVGRELMVQATLNALGVGAHQAGGLDRLRIVQMLVFVTSTPAFEEQSKVADAGSDLLVSVLGENGRHARTAIGVASLPRRSPVEVQMVCEQL